MCQTLTAQCILDLHDIAGATTATFVRSGPDSPDSDVWLPDCRIAKTGHDVGVLVANPTWFYPSSLWCLVWLTVLGLPWMLLRDTIRRKRGCNVGSSSRVLARILLHFDLRSAWNSQCTCWPLRCCSWLPTCRKITDHFAVWCKFPYLTCADRTGQRGTCIEAGSSGFHEYVD